MKKIAFVLSFAALFAFASDAPAQKQGKGGDEKKGFLTSKWCAQQGYFKDCRLESFVCGGGDCFKDWNFGDNEKEELVLFVHDEGKIYDVKLDGLPRYKLDGALNSDGVTMIGSIEGATIKVNDFKAPPPAAKEFFKGCL